MIVVRQGRALLAWRCRGCSAEIGELRGTHVLIRNREASVLVTGTIVVICRCLTRNEVTVQ